MLLIILLGVIAKLTLVSCDCDFGTLPMKDFVFRKFADNGTWYLSSHKSNDFENKLDCPKAKLSIPVGGRSTVTSDMYHTSEQRHIIHYGNITNWNSNGCMDIYHPVESWNGRHCVISIDYDSYFIMKVCPFNSNKLSVYVGIRSSQPNEATKWDVTKALKDNNIDASKLLRLPANHCSKE